MKPTASNEEMGHQGIDTKELPSKKKQNINTNVLTSKIFDPVFLIYKLFNKKKSLLR